jgi:type VI protein secretion system component VasK
MISEKLSAIQSLDGDNVVTIFNGKSTDPLFDLWNYTNNALSSMPEALALSIRTLLLAPSVFTGKAISLAIKKQLNTLWKNDVAAMYDNRFLGKYPFLQKEEEASFTEVMDFFRPATGIFWGFYDRRLSPFVIKSNGQWQVKTVGTVDVGFSPKLIETLKKAERIREMFYQPDGTQRILELTMSSVKTNKNRAILKMLDKEFPINPGNEEEKARFRWPFLDAPKNVPLTISLKIFASESDIKSFNYSGQWGLLRLFEESRINVINPQSFVSKWQANVQNMYMVFFASRVTVSGSDHPFCDKVFYDFVVPETITAD